NANITAVVTGGASGLGEATARKLAALGVKVGIIDMNEEKGQALAAELGGAFAKVNVTSDEEVTQGFAKLRAALGQERLLINCAGIGDAVKTASRDRETGGITPHSMKRFQRVLDINLSGTFRCIAESAAGMMTLDPVDGERGAIVNTASAAAEDGQVGQAAYAASKAGIVGMTLPIARDLSRELIRVNTILPGIFDTPLLASAPEPVRQALGAMVPHPARLGVPAEFASLAIEMCRNSYFNGEDVRLDGAIRMAPK
ncbi:SDR family NAD(P)-dependent oxidoreductase, partial [Porticoccaceae bacterium]|nr:SDR family NAD(P)-dependent oxidoreductase [Porticoccaceae bacterium]